MQGEQLHPAEHRVADEHPESPGVQGDPARTRRDDLGLRLVGGVGQLLPLVEQAGVGLPDHFAQPLDQVGEILVHLVRRHGLPQRLVGVAQIAQYDALGAREPVEPRCTRRTSSPARTCPGPPTSATTRRPRSTGGVCRYISNVASSNSLSGFGQVTSSSSSIRSSYSMPSAFIAFTASPRAWCSCAHSTARGSSSVASTTETTSSAYSRILRIEQVQRGQRERRQRLVQREVLLQVDGEAQQPAVLVGLVKPLDHTGGDERCGRSGSRAGSAGPGRPSPRGCRAAGAACSRTRCRRGR